MHKSKSYKLSKNLIAGVFSICFTIPFISAQNISFDKELGKKEALNVASQIGIYHHEEAKAYIQAIGTRLIQQIDDPVFEYIFELVDMAEPNAFALPGGYIFVSRGLLCVANTEDELAGVIGHEIIHSEKRHSVQQMRKSIFPSLLQLPGAIIGTVVNEDLGNLINIPLGAGSELLMSKYSRNHEKEADELGVQIVAEAGYDPSQLAIILNNLSREVENLTGEKEKFSYFNSHPITPDRVKYIEKEVSKLSINDLDPIVASHEDFLKKVEGVYFWDNPEEGIFKGDTFMHPDLGIFCIFPEGWSTFNSPTFVGAMDENNERGMIYLGMADTNATPEYLGNVFVNKLKQKHQAVPERNEKILLNGLDAYIVSIMDRTDAEPVGIHHLWFALNNNTYRVIGASYQSEYELLKISANTLRPITDKEKESIEVPVLRYIAACENETLPELNERSGNAWSIELTAIMNDISPDRLLEKGQWVKIVRNEKYMKRDEK